MLQQFAPFMAALDVGTLNDGDVVRVGAIPAGVAEGTNTTIDFAVIGSMGIEGGA